MAANPCIQCRVTQETKDRLGAIARERQVTESALLKRLVETALLTSVGAAERSVAKPAEQVGRVQRVYVRLRREDHQLIRERARGRDMAAATYVSYLVRAYLRALKPFPDREVDALRSSVNELRGIGRNLNQIANAANRGDR